MLLRNTKLNKLRAYIQIVQPLTETGFAKLRWFFTYGSVKKNKG